MMQNPKKKPAVNGSSVGGNVFLLKEVSGDWPDWFELT